MSEGALLRVAAVAVGLAAMCLVLFVTNWLAEAVMPLVAGHLRAIAMLVSPFAGMIGTFVALAAVYQHRRKEPEEPMRPWIRNRHI